MALSIWTYTNYTTPYKRSQGFPVVETEFEGGVKDIRAKWPYGPVKIALNYKAEGNTDTVAMYDFYVARQGKVDPFLFQDIFDVAITAEAVGTGDTSETVFYLDKKYPVNGTLVVYLNGSPQTETTHYTVDYELGEITFLSPPGGGVAITADYEWYRKVRFASEAFSFDEFAYLFYNFQLELEEVFPT